MVVNNTEELTTTFNRLITNESFRKDLGLKNKEFVLKNKNATKVVMDFIEKQL